VTSYEDSAASRNADIDQELARARELLRSGVYDPIYHRNQISLLRGRYIDTNHNFGEENQSVLVTESSWDATLLEYYYMGLCAHVRCLPREVLGEIFLWARDLEDSPHAPKSSMQFSWVCFSWREAALACPDLWSRLCIPIKVTTSPNFDYGPGLEAIRLLDDFVQRSGSCPLDIKLTNISTDRTADHIFSIMRSSIAQCRGLWLPLERRTVGHRVMEFESFGCLQDLHLEGPSADILLRFQCVKSLRSLHISSLGRTEMPPFTQVKDLTLILCDLNKCSILLDSHLWRRVSISQCTLATAVRMKASRLEYELRYGMESLNKLSVVTVEGLKELCIRNASLQFLNEELLDFLMKCGGTGVELLEIMPKSDVGDCRIVSKLLPFLPDITSLAISDFAAYPAVANGWYQTDITYNTMFNPRFIQDLTIDGDDQEAIKIGILLPCLHTAKFMLRPQAHYLWQPLAFAKMIASRWRRSEMLEWVGIAKLENVVIKQLPTNPDSLSTVMLTEDILGPAACTILEELRNEGMIVLIF
jgi:hypothetical protein